MKSIMIAILATGLVAACASTPEVRPDITAAAAALDAARRADAIELAPEAFRAAEDRLARARAAQEDRDEAAAARLAAESTAQSHYATAKADFEKRKRAYEALDRTVEVLRRETRQ